MKPVIEPYCSEYEQSVQDLYFGIANKKKSKRLCVAMYNRPAMRRTWQAGMVGLIGIHLHRLSNWLTVLFELTLWSAGVGLACYVWLDGEYARLVRTRGRLMIKDLEQVRTTEQGNAWVMVQEQNVTGVVALWVDHNEGRIKSLTGVESQIEPMLVMNAIDFGIQGGVKVFARDADATWSVSSF